MYVSHLMPFDCLTPQWNLSLSQWIPAQISATFSLVELVALGSVPDGRIIPPIPSHVG